MKTVLLHGLGQTAQDWQDVVCQISSSDVDCPELFHATGNEISYSQILGNTAEHAKGKALREDSTRQGIYTPFH